MEKWYIEFPTLKYKEDVVTLAKENNLEIVDAKFNGGEVSKGEKFPKLTLKKEEPYGGEVTEAEEAEAEEAEAKPKKQTRAKAKKGQ